ncbi:DNA-binding domain-containing protein, AraC-type [Herbaspirillum sp. CF444]|uniref:helix-turn-helix transcriptional regulator n=1 Tax=Herbaspirillum sp. CF444 TaxID=1144319 RepID=UPI0002723F75|nr:helix-turn-helix transcriptional regulator [Herbaspirillum sp. CF444]EJL94430.1 DNA-binding domain-containing protein, AraC-type [Herbaspirillum sp. CF444]
MQRVTAGQASTPHAIRRNALLADIRDYIHERLDQNWLTPATIQAAFRLSRPTLYRLFEAEGGLMEYIRNCRLREAAAEMIDSPESAIVDIAYGAGFNSASDFCRAFRRAYGMTPRHFRQCRLAPAGAPVSACCSTPSAHAPGFP